MPEGDAILLLHGFSNTHRAWRRLLDAGVGEARNVLAPDIRGHGARGDMRPVSLPAVLDDIAAILPARCTLLGYSQGGRIALHAALDGRIAPHLSRLVLIGASPGLTDHSERVERRELDDALARRIEPWSIEEFAEVWARMPVLSGLPPHLAAEAHADRLHNSTAGLAAALRGLGTGALPSVWDRLAALGVPVTLIAGERDTKFTAIAQKMAARIPDVQVVVVPGVGHQVHLEAPETVAELLLNP